jgi:hypothetical protein
MVQATITSHVSWYISILWIAIVTILLNAYTSYVAIDFPKSTIDWLILPVRAIVKIAHNLYAKLRNINANIINFQLIIILLILSILTIALSTMLVLTVNAYTKCSLVISCYLDTYGMPWGIIQLILLIIFTVLITGVIFSAALGSLSSMWDALHDPIHLRYLFMNPMARPTSVDDAISILGSLKTESGRVQYIRVLHNWLPVSHKWQKLLEEAAKYTGESRDELCKLAEIWQEFDINLK